MTTVTPDVWRAYGQQFVDQHYAYCIDCDRCGGSCHCLDCSGLQCRISNGLGITRGLCTTSFVISQQCWDAGLYTDQATAEADSGPDVFYAVHGANYGRTDDGSQPNGASGHIVTVVRVRNPDGTTARFYTIEAMGHAYGVVNGTYENRGWTGRYRIPGVVTGPPPPPPPPPVPQEEPVLIQAPHPPIPSTSIATASWSPAHPTDVLLEHGASIAGDEPVGDPKLWKPGMPRVWRNLDGSGHPMALTGITPRVKLYPDPEAGQPTGTGIVSRDVHGGTHIGNWSH